MLQALRAFFPRKSACVLAAFVVASAAAGFAQQAPAAAASAQDTQAGTTEDELRQMLVGKTFYLRSGWLDDSLSFNEHGALSGHSAQGSYTLSLVEIDRVRLAKHKLTLEGARYGLHFLGALPYEDPTTAVDKVRITPKKKIVRITIDREQVVKPKKEKPEKSAKSSAGTAPGSDTAGADSGATATSDGAANQPSDADQLKADIAATPEADRPADAGSITPTTSPAHAAKVLKDALDAIFAPNLDGHMMAAMPDFWKLYYQAAAAKKDYQPADPTVMRQSAVDQKARLLSSFEPGSNEYAQQNGVAGMALYHTVIGSDGKPLEISVGRPIGFGLDENAVTAIRAAKFAPALKDGKPVPVLLDLVVQFRIFSKRTAAGTTTTASASEIPEPAAPAEQPKQLPGPYSVGQPQQQ